MLWNMTSPASIVSTADLHRTYGEGEAAVHALRGVTVAFPTGQFTAIMGPSGSGKSTLMHILAGLDKPSSGSVEIDGIELTTLKDNDLTKLRRRHIGFVFQFFNLLPMLSAEENILLPLSIAGEKPEPAWIAELLDATGLADRRSHRPSELSGGQQQRVAVARALANAPALLLADEPTGNLDSRNAEALLEVLGELARAGQTVVMVTHDPGAAAYADQVVFLVDGAIVEQLDQPTRERVLEVMGRLGG